MDSSHRIKTLAQTELTKHLLDRRLGVALNVNHVCLYIDESVFFYQIVKKLDTSIIGSNLSFKVSDVVFQVSCSNNKWVDVFGLVGQNISQFCFIEYSIFDDLESHELSALFINMLRESRHGTRLNASNIRMVTS